jgi:pimeloyl-ACP methyl ester carboxylesterase
MPAMPVGDAGSGPGLRNERLWLLAISDVIARMASERIILFPGMACDERLFAPQRECGLQFESPPLPMPKAHETLAAYAVRVGEQLSLGDNPCVLGGVSFGGMLACELAAVCNCREVVLVASCRSAEAVPVRNWPVFWLASLMPDLMIRRLVAPSSHLVAWMESIGQDHRRLVVDMCRDMPVALLRHQAAMILRWKQPSKLRCRVRHLHGTRDRLIPFENVVADQSIPGGGHFINLTHPGEVTSFIAGSLA